MDEKQAREDIAEVARLTYARGYICGCEGNFSVRLSADLVLTTPRGICKGRLQPEDLILCDLDGKPVKQASSNGGKPSTELDMHLTAYRVRPDIGAVVHAHPTAAVGFTVAGMSLTPCILPEVVCTLGTIPTAPYATPSTDEVSKAIADIVKQYDALMMDHHGALTVGKDIWEAYFKLETLEHHAQTLLVAHLLGGAKPLYASQVKQLLKIRGVYGLDNQLPVEYLIGKDCSAADPEKVS